MMLAFERKDPWWPLPVINDLESMNTGNALSWACAFIASQLPECDNRDANRKRAAWLAEIRTLPQTRPSVEELYKRSREVWYDGGTRDRIQTAISRLYEAVVGLIDGNHRGYCRAVAMAICVAAGDDDGQPSIAVLEQMVKVYLSERQAR
jgi:hypothetical protein